MNQSYLRMMKKRGISFILTVVLENSRRGAKPSPSHLFHGFGGQTVKQKMTFQKISETCVMFSDIIRYLLTCCWHVVCMLCACCASHKSVQNKRIVCAEFAHGANKSDLFCAKLSSCKTQKSLHRDLCV